MAAVKVTKTLRTFWRFHRWLYEASDGRLGTRMGKQHLLRLATNGRETGLPRVVILTFVEHAGVFYVVGSNAGEDRHPAWCQNLQAHPEAEVRVKRAVFPVTAHELTGRKREEIWSQFVTLDKAYQTYQDRTDRIIPVMALTPRNSTGMAGAA